jgi:hypothetical protein
VSGGARQNADSALIAALAAGGTVAASAKSAGVSEATAHRRLADPAFRKLVDEARAAAIARAVARLSATATLAADTLHRLLNANAETVQLGAARAILDLGLKLREHEDLATRVAALEAMLSEREGVT